MKVKELIALLKKMPPNAVVVTNMHDNDEWEIAGYVANCEHMIKDDLIDGVIEHALPDDVQSFKTYPDEWVVLGN